MNINIKDISPEDRDFVLDINEADVEVLSPMDMDKLKFYEQIAEIFWVIEVDGQRAAFLIGVSQGADYPNENFDFFSEKYDKFLYVDRIVIAEPYRNCGLGKKIYKAAKEYAVKNGIPVITAEVELEPVYNEISIQFHKKIGFKEVGLQKVRGGEIKVSLIAWDVKD